MPTDTLLRRTLTANAAISLPWGLAVTLGAPFLADRLGVPRTGTVVVGLVAVAAGVLFGVLARREVLRPSDGWVAAVGDVAFGVTMIVFAFTLPEVTTLGRWLVGLSGLATIDLGITEVVGTRRLTAERASRTTLTTA